jgi:hypothetical protein
MKNLIFVAALLLAGCGSDSGPVHSLRPGFLSEIVSIEHNVPPTTGAAIVRNLDTYQLVGVVFKEDFNGELAPGKYVVDRRAWIAYDELDDPYIVDLP